MKINSYDRTGRVIPRKVKLVKYSYKKGYEKISINQSIVFGNITIDFGCGVSYGLKSLLKDFPYKNELIIDGRGANHYGSQVFINKEDLNDFLEIFV
jgi:hypothetical protein